MLSGDSPAFTPEGVVFASGEASDILSVTVTNESGTFNFHFDPDEGGYVTDDIPPFIVDVDVFTLFLTNSARLSAIRTIPPREAQEQDWGLDDPSAEVEIIFFDDTVLRFSIGDVERISGNYFAAVEGFEGVHIISRAIAMQFLLPKIQIISPFITPPLAISSSLSAIRDITFSGGQLEHPVTIQAAFGTDDDITLAAMSFGGATHIVHSAGIYELDQSYGSYIFGSLFGIVALDVIGYGLTNEEVMAYGFDEPYMTIDYDMINNSYGVLEWVSLQIVEAEDNLFYITIEGSGVVYLIGREPFLDIQFDRLLLRWFLTPFLMDLSSVTVTTQDDVFHLEIDNTDTRDPIITYNDQKLSTDLFRAFYRLLTSAAHDGIFLGELPAPVGTSILEITYEYLDDRKQPDTLSLYPGGVRRHNVYINGTGEFAIRDLFAERVLQGIADLIAGRTVEEDW